MKESLLSLRNPYTGEEVVEAVYKKEEIYSGEYLNNVPDLIFETENMKYLLCEGTGRTILKN